MNNIRHFPTALTLMRRISSERKVSRVFHLPADLDAEIASVEEQVRGHGLSFPLDHQVAACIRSILKIAREQLATLSGRDSV